MFLSEWREFPSAPSLAGGEKTWWQLASRCCWNRGRPWHASELVSFIVGLRTYQHPGTDLQTQSRISKTQKEYSSWKQFFNDNSLRLATGTWSEDELWSFIRAKQHNGYKATDCTRGQMNFSQGQAQSGNFQVCTHKPRQFRNEVAYKNPWNISPPFLSAADASDRFARKIFPIWIQYCVCGKKMDCKLK